MIEQQELHRRSIFGLYALVILVTVVTAAGSTARADTRGQQRELAALLAEFRSYSGASSTAWLVDVALGRAGKATGPPPPERKNPYLKKVDSAIAHPALRAAVRRVQPAAVRLGGGSDVNLDRGGLVLTAAHLVDRKQSPVQSPRRNRRVRSRAEINEQIPTLLRTAGEARGGRIVRYAQGEQRPRPEWIGVEIAHLFLRDDLHNSWDCRAAMRHALPWEAIAHFLSAHRR